MTSLKNEDKHEKVTREVLECSRTKAQNRSSKNFAYKTHTFTIFALNFVREQLNIYRLRSDKLLWNDTRGNLIQTIGHVSFCKSFCKNMARACGGADNKHQLRWGRRTKGKDSEYLTSIGVYSSNFPVVDQEWLEVLVALQGGKCQP